MKWRETERRNPIRTPQRFFVTKTVVGVNYNSGSPQVTAELISRTKGCSWSIDHFSTTCYRGCDRKDGDVFGTSTECRSCFLYSVQTDRPGKCQSCHLLEDSIVWDCGLLQQLPVGGLVNKANNQKTKKGRKKATPEAKQKQRLKM